MEERDLMAVKLWAIVSLTALHGAHFETNFINCTNTHTNSTNVCQTYDVIVERASYKMISVGNFWISMHLEIN